MRNLLSRSAAVLALCLAATLQISCSSGSDVAGVARVATTILISPNGATIDAIGASQTFQVTVLDQHGDPMEDITVSWSTQSGGVASVTSAGTVTAQANGSTQVIAKAGALEASASLTVEQVVAALSRISGDNQQGVVGSILPAPLQVRALDRMNNAVPGAPITFEVGGNGGSLSTVVMNADANGDAFTQWTLSTVAAAHSVVARATGVENVTTTFTGTATAGPPALMQKVAGDAQVVAVGNSVPVLPTVRVTDVFGNAIAGAGVAFQVMAGGGNVAGASPSTNALGTASPASWQMGSSPGQNILRATSPMVAALDFTADAVTGPPAAATAHQGNNQNAQIGTAVAVQPGVRITDALGNPVPGFAVTFAVTGGGGSITGANALTDADGVARVGSWTMGLAAGANQLTATVTPLAAVVFSATATVVPANIAVHAGNNQSANAGTQVNVAPAVKVTTAQGHPAPGVPVSFQVISGGGSITGASAVSDANGVATLGSWTLGTQVGPNSLTASATGLNIVIFNAQGTVGPPASLQIHAGNSQSAATSTAVAIDPAVKILDAFQNPVSGVSVSFVVIAGGGVVAGSPAVTDNAGVAAVDSWTLGGTQGQNQLRADVAGLPSVTFNATATVQPASMFLFAGGGQSATVGTQVSVPPAVRVLDAGFAPVQGVSVTFSVTAGGGNITGMIATTDANGVATVGSWTLGTIAGTNTLTATAATLAPLPINATGVAGAAASIAVHAGNNQTAAPGAQVPIAPAAIVRDQFANPVSGVTVTFDVTGGGGSVAGAVQITSSQGVAAVVSWTIGAGANSLSATATGGGISGNPVTFNATGQVSAFNIELEYLTGVTPAQQAAFDAALAKWQSIIIGDIPAVNVNLPAGDCGSNSPAFNGSIDDLRIYVTLEPIDGAGSILGSAGPCRLRVQGLLPATGRMRFDVADLAGMEASGILDEVIMHEMGHVLGIGTIWTFLGFLVNPSLPSSPGVDTHFNGANAIAGFDAVGGSGYVSGQKVPVENAQGGAGTRDSHWRESLLGNELMTGFIGAGSNPLSLLTVRQMQDLGYTVDVGAADPFVYSGGNISADIGSLLHLKGDVNPDPIRFINH